MAITLGELLFQLSSKAHCSEKVIYLSHAWLNSSHERPFFSCFLGQSPHNNYTYMFETQFTQSVQFPASLFFCVCSLCGGEDFSEETVFSKWVFTSLFMTQAFKCVCWYDICTHVFLYALVILRLFKVANCLNYYYLVIVLLVIEAIVHLHHVEIIAVSLSLRVCACL